MSDIRCREDRLRGRGDDVEREGVGRQELEVMDGEEVRESKGETMKVSMVGVVDEVRAEKAVGVIERVFDVVLTDAWSCLGASVVSKAFDAYPNSERSEYGGVVSTSSDVLSLLGPSQSKPLPIDVTAQLPTLAAL